MNKLYKVKNKQQHFLLIFILLIVIAGCKQKIIESEPAYEYTFEKIFDLPMQVRESSGLLFFDSLIWTFNDSGNESKICGISIHTGDIEREIYFNVKQNDWEDISQDSLFIFIGDFGNNFGSREKLSVIRFLKSQVSKLPEQFISAEIIEYSYPDQTDFSSNYRNSSFDCEALLSYGDSLILFTKDWVNNMSSVYQIPKTPGKYIASKVCKIESEGLITSADYDRQTNKLVLVGYSDFVPFLIIVNNFDLHKSLIKRLVKYNFDDFQAVKVEGVTIINNNVWISSEGNYYQQALYKIIKK